MKNIDKLCISFPYIFPFLKKLVFWGHDRQLVNTGKVRSDHGVLKQAPKTVLYSRDNIIERCKHCVLMMWKFSALSLWRLPWRGRDWGLGDSTMANMCWVFAMCQASLLACYLYCFYYYIDSSRVGVVISILYKRELRNIEANLPKLQVNYWGFMAKQWGSNMHLKYMRWWWFSWQIIRIWTRIQNDTGNVEKGTDGRGLIKVEFVHCGKVQEKYGQKMYFI